MSSPRQRQAAEALPELLEHLYQAATDADHWPRFLAALATQVEGGLAALHVLDFHGHQASVMMTHGLEAPWQQAYEQHYGRINPWLHAHRGTPQVGQINDSEALLPADALLASEFYNGFLRPQQLRYSLGIVVEQSASTAVTLTTLRSPQAGAYGEHERRLYRHLLPHLVRALAIQSRLLRSQASNEQLGWTLEQLACGVAQLDRGGCVLWLNEQAQSIATRARGLTLAENRPLGIVRCGQTRWPLAGTILGTAQLLAGLPAPLLFTFPNRGGGADIEAVLMPVPRRQRQGDVRFVLFLIDPMRQPRRFVDLIAARFGLTPTEAMVAQHLCQGASPADVAATLDVSQETIKSHVKRLFHKTGTSRQAQLIARLRRGIAGWLADDLE